MSQILNVESFWFNYYTTLLPKMIINSKPEAEKIIAELFAGLEGKIKRAIKYWRKLSDDDKKLLANAFRIVIKTKFSPPFALFNAGIDEIRKNELTDDRKQKLARDPLEIVARPQGVLIDEIEAVYIPDGADQLEIYPIVLERMKTLGIDGKLRPISDLNDIAKYPTSNSPYGRFNLGLIAQYIREKKLVPLLPSEWEGSGIL